MKYFCGDIGVLLRSTAIVFAQHKRNQYVAYIEVLVLGQNVCLLFNNGENIYEDRSPKTNLLDVCNGKFK